MSRILLYALTIATALVFWPLRLNGQRPAQLLADALDQILARRLDSAITLLDAVTTSPQADSSERADAFVWLGVATFYKNQDSAAGYAFRDALRYNPLVTPTGSLAQLDSGLTALWEREQTTVLCGEALPAWRWGPSPTDGPLNSDARAAQGPKIVSGPQVPYPDNLRRAGIQGRVVVRAVIDSLGRAERGSIRILRTAHPGFNVPVTEYTEDARFSVAISSAGRIRSCVVFAFDFRIRH